MLDTQKIITMKEIKIRSKYNLYTFKAFLKFVYIKLFFLAYICGIALIAIGVALAFLSKSSYIVYIFSGVLLPVILHVFYRVMILQAIKRNIGLSEGIIQFFCFNDDGFELEQISHYESFKERYLYKDIYSVVKYKRYYFVYINRYQAFIIENEDYVYGNEEEFDELLKKMKKERFIIKSNSKKGKKKNIETINR